ncbi:SRPBCC family protein [Nocardia sp. NEAU-G5]|uniref:SRPBCC family protein n=1 Tax=Nocardia albiluteola TaxID=2842303 RepID=A0ABS6AR71_9NOCA|nr:SRPBCC family protein [Nocardia albiluteola]MBU3060519.1 SRPBCC family protein [Nocardia albiluteola]
MTKQNLSATIDIAAAPDRVWRVLSDLRRMPEFSTQCRLMRPLGSPRMGSHTLNMNRHGHKYWPTISRIEQFAPDQTLAFRTLSNDSVWSFGITPIPTGSTVTHRRTVPPEGTSWGSRTIVEHWLGGEDNFDVAMADGMQTTLRKLKEAVETNA